MMARRGGCGIERWGVWAWDYDQPPRVCMCVCVPSIEPQSRVASSCHASAHLRILLHLLRLQRQHTMPVVNPRTRTRSTVGECFRRGVG